MVKRHHYPTSRRFTDKARTQLCVCAGRPHDRALDLVISHFALHNLRDTMNVWAEVIDLPNLRPLEPYMFLYCKNGNVSQTDLIWFEHQGEVRHLANVGRESHTYVWHVLHNYADLANHTVFHQDIPDSMQTLTSRLGLLTPRTGMLGLAVVSACHCKTGCGFEQPLPKITEIWSMVRHSFCAPEDIYLTFLRGAFLVSSRRILAPRAACLAIQFLLMYWSVHGISCLTV